MIRMDAIKFYVERFSVISIILFSKHYSDDNLQVPNPLLIHFSGFFFLCGCYCFRMQRMWWSRRKAVQKCNGRGDYLCCRGEQSTRYFFLSFFFSVFDICAMINFLMFILWFVERNPGTVVCFHCWNGVFIVKTFSRICHANLL